MTFSPFMSTLKRKLFKFIFKESENWIQYLTSLYIIRKKDGICLFSHHFQIGNISHIEMQLVGMGFAALSNMMQEVIGKRANLRKIEIGCSLILFNNQETILGVLICKKELPIIHSRLDEMSSIFESTFFLQQQICDVNDYVCLEDFALAEEIVAYVFNENASRFMSFIPFLFRSIQLQSRKIWPLKNTKNHQKEESYILRH